MNKDKSQELTITLKDVAATEQLGALVAGALSDGTLVFLQGDLGAGKTTLVRGLLRRLGYQGAVKSPTYTLLEEYLIDEKKIIHFDLYRLTDPEELDLIGIRDYFDDKSSCLIEWPQRGQGHLPQQDLEIQISLDGSGRSARILSFSNRGIKVLKAIQDKFYSA
jgi:tRNA threonylcarbamoyladenosine biosynthesis protein TsaE